MKNSVLLFLLMIFISGITQSIISQPNYPRNPDEAKMVFTDLENFLEAYENLQPGVDSVAVLNEYYFDKASVGLQEYISKHNLTPELMIDAIYKEPKKYELLDNFINNIEETKKEFTNSLDKFNDVLPDAMYPPTYLLVGANRGIAQASKFGQLVTLTKVVDDQDKLMMLIIHELSHFQQAMHVGPEKYVSLYSTPDNMLGLCLREGGAEFITSLTLDRITQEKALSYIEQNEVELKTKFINDLKDQDSKYWLWESLNQNEHPKLLGYAMGYKICESYYNNSDDKKNALTDILSITQPEQFLSKSKYFPIIKE
jgi:hypothetical protein